MTESTDDTTTDEQTQHATPTENEQTQGDETIHQQTPGKGKKPGPRAIEPAVPEEFGLVQLWWGAGKGKTTAAMGMGFRAAGHGYRVHMLQFMKGGAASVEDVRGEYNAIEALPGFTYENLGHYGWHELPDGTDEEKHEQNAQAGLDRAREIIEDSRDVSGPIPLDAAIAEGCHLLVLDEILYAANRGLIDSDAVRDLVVSKPDTLELVLTGGHERPDYVTDLADLVSHVENESHPIDEGQRARKGTEF